MEIVARERSMVWKMMDMIYHLGIATVFCDLGCFHMFQTLHSAGSSLQNINCLIDQYMFINQSHFECPKIIISPSPFRFYLVAVMVDSNRGSDRRGMALTARAAQLLICLGAPLLLFPGLKMWWLIKSKKNKILIQTTWGFTPVTMYVNRDLGSPELEPQNDLWILETQLVGLSDWGGCLLSGTF